MDLSEAEDLVRRAYDDGWNRGNLDAMLQLVDENIVLRPSGKIVDLAQEYHGHDGVRRFWADVRAPWERLAIDVDKVVVHEGRVLVLFRFQAKGREGMEVDAKFGQVGTVEAGLVTTLTAYPDWGSAAEAIGLDLDEI